MLKYPLYEIISTHLPLAYHGFCDTHDPILPKVSVRSQTHDSVRARTIVETFTLSLRPATKMPDHVNLAQGICSACAKLSSKMAPIFLEAPDV